MNSRRWRRIVPALIVLAPLYAYAAGSKPEITRLDTDFLDNNVNVNVHWQSANPVVLVKILVGAEQKEVKIDEYDNKRTSRGYTGEATVVLPAQPRPGLDFVNYVIYLEDDLRQKSDQRTGKVKLPQATATAQAGLPPQPGMPMGVQVGVAVQMGQQPWGGPPGTQPPPPPGMPGGGQFGPQPGAPGMPGAMAPMPGMPGAPSGPQAAMDPNQPGLQPGGQPGMQMGMQPSGQFNLMPPAGAGGVVDKVLAVMDRTDLPPTLQDITVNLVGSNVTFTSRANDDKGLREITFRIFDGGGNKIQEFSLTTNLGKTWQGTTNPVSLPPGKYSVIAKAVDTAGNSSKERTAAFEMAGQPGQFVQPMPPTPTQPGPQAQPGQDSQVAQPAPAAPPWPAAQGQPGQDPSPSNIPAAPAPPQPSTGTQQ